MWKSKFDQLIGFGSSCSFQHCMSISSSMLVQATANVLSGVNSDAMDAIGASKLDKTADIH